MINNPIHRVLVIRLALVASCLALILMVLVFWVELRNLDQRIQDQATVALESLRGSIIDELDTDGLGNREQIQRILEKNLRIQNSSAQSSFAYVRILDSAFREVAAFINPAQEQIESAIQEKYSGANQVKHGASALWKRISRINGTLVVQLRKDLVNSEGKPVAHVEGAYVVSSRYIQKARYDAALSALFAAGIVLITTLILYPAIIRLLGKLTGLSAGLAQANLEIMSVLGGAIAKRDIETSTHNCRVTIYAIRIAQDIGLQDDDMRSLIKGAFLHDVGKIGVRDSVLLKPGSLTPEEYEETKQHVRHGLDIVGRSTWLTDAALVVGGHHEKYDGSGYPQGRKGKEIPLVARIFAVADVFDALTSKRHYKENMGWAEALEIISHGRGSHFDPDVLDIFNDIASELFETYGVMDDTNLKSNMIKLAAGYFMFSGKTILGSSSYKTI